MIVNINSVDLQSYEQVNFIIHFFRITRTTKLVHCTVKSVSVIKTVLYACICFLGEFLTHFVKTTPALPLANQPTFNLGTLTMTSANVNLNNVYHWIIQ